MTLAIGFQTKGVMLLVALATPGYRPDPTLWRLIAALALAAGGLVTSVALGAIVAGPGLSKIVQLPALAGALAGAWLALETGWREVRR